MENRIVDNIYNRLVNSCPFVNAYTEVGIIKEGQTHENFLHPQKSNIYFIPVYFLDQPDKVLLYIPFPINYKSFNPKSHEESVYKTSGSSFKSDDTSITIINKLIKRNSKKLIPFRVERIIIKGLTNLNYQQLYFAYRFLRQCFEKVE